MVWYDNNLKNTFVFLYVYIVQKVMHSSVEPIPSAKQKSL